MKNPLQAVSNKISRENTTKEKRTIDLTNQEACAIPKTHSIQINNNNKTTTIKIAVNQIVLVKNEEIESNKFDLEVRYFG